VNWRALAFAALALVVLVYVMLETGMFMHGDP
jgi:hypothetical protein